MSPTARWKHRSEGSNWGDFGADDQMGKLNLLGPETVRRAVSEVGGGAHLLPQPAVGLSGRQ